MSEHDDPSRSTGHLLTPIVALRYALNRFLNPRRLRDYPRLMLLAVSAIMVAHIFLRQGWLGGLGQIIGSDFITLYAAGDLYRTDPALLYDLDAQFEAQQQLVAPTSLPGLNPFISPPYVASAYSVFGSLRPATAFAVWTVITVVAVVVSARIVATHLLPEQMQTPGVSTMQLSVVTLSSFAFVEGFMVGQNHGVTLFLVVAVCAAVLRGRWWVAGLLGGFLIYKPHLALGLLLMWLVWRKLPALIGFSISALAWVLPTLPTVGLEAYRAYLSLGDQLLLLPYVDGFPAYLMVTPYGLLSTLLTQSQVRLVQSVTAVLSTAVVGVVVAVAWRCRDVSLEERGPALAAALLAPLLMSPYTLLHDLVLLLPILVLITRGSGRRRAVVHSAVACYVGALFLPLIGHQIGVALVAIIPIGVALTHFGHIWTATKCPGARCSS